MGWMRVGMGESWEGRKSGEKGGAEVKLRDRGITNTGEAIGWDRVDNYIMLKYK